MKYVLKIDGIYGKAGETVELGEKKIKELELMETPAPKPEPKKISNLFKNGKSK